MAGRKFVLRFPIFALRRNANDYFCIKPQFPRPYQDSLLIPLFTSEAKAIQYKDFQHEQCDLARFVDPKAFRPFLLELSKLRTLLAFDLIPVPGGKLRAKHVFPANVVMKKYMPEPGDFIWNYPVYVIGTPDGFEYARAEREGKPYDCLMVYTDLDLIQRDIAKLSPGGAPVALQNAKMFAELLRGMPDIGVILFDPPAVRQGEARFGMLRDEVLKLIRDRG